MSCRRWLYFCHIISSSSPRVSVPEGTVLNPLLFSLYINSISTDIDSEIRLFADDCVCYREIKDTEDTVKLQKDIDQLGCWSRKWGMGFQPAKCNMMQLTRKRIKTIHVSYTLEGTVLENVESISIPETQSIRLSTRCKRGSVQRTSAPCPGVQRFVVGLQDELEKCQNRAARLVTGNYHYETGRMTGILEHLN